jgi:hypothetical protein
MDRFGKVANVSTIVAMLSCMIMGFFGYLAFTSKIEGSYLVTCFNAYLTRCTIKETS